MCAGQPAHVSGEPCVRCQSPRGVRRAPRQGDGQRGVDETKLGEEGSLRVGQPVGEVRAQAGRGGHLWWGGGGKGQRRFQVQEGC